MLKPLFWRQSPFKLLMVAGLLLSFPTTALAQDQELRILTVTGQGTENIATTLTEVQLGVEIQGETAEAVQQEVAERTSAVVELLRSRNVEQLQTTGVRLQPAYDFSNNDRRLIGYMATNTVSFRLPTEQAGSLLDEAVQAGATQIDGVSFTATEGAITEAQQQALRDAVEDAQQQAQAVLQALNFTAKEIVSIQVNGANTPRPQVFEAAQLAREAASTPIIGGEQAVQASVTLEISY